MVGGECCAAEACVSCACVQGELNGSVGLFPSNYVEPCKDPPKPRNAPPAPRPGLFLFACSFCLLWCAAGGGIGPKDIQVGLGGGARPPMQTGMGAGGPPKAAARIPIQQQRQPEETHGNGRANGQHEAKGAKPAAGNGGPARAMPVAGQLAAGVFEFVFWCVFRLLSRVLCAGLNKFLDMLPATGSRKAKTKFGYLFLNFFFLFLTPSAF